MRKRLGYAAASVIVALALFGSSAQAQNPRLISVEWQNARFADVVASLATFSGRSILLDGSLAERRITAAFTNAEWESVLRTLVVLEGATSRVDSSNAIRIVRQAPSTRRVTVEWQSAPLNRVLDAFAQFSGQQIVLGADVVTREVTARYENVDWRSALDDVLSQQALVARTDSSGVLRVTLR